MKYLLQIDGTERDKWQTISATSPHAAIFKAVQDRIKQGENPAQAYIALGESRHPNGTPICVQGYKLQVNREANLQG